MSQSQNERSDALFEELSRKKKKRRNKIIRNVIIVLVVLAVVLVAAVSIMTRQVREQFASAGEEVLHYDATKGTISTTVSGSGTLAEVDLESITVPAGVEITEVLKDVDAVIAQGDVLATVDMTSVLNAMAEVQGELDSLDEQISDAKDEEVESYITAGIEGRVKILYAEEGESVANCMADHGAVAVLSLDGYMAVDIETDALAAADAVTVIRADGSEISGKVDHVSGGTATVLVTDKGPEYGEEVAVLGEDGTEIGAGKLYIHAPLGVIGYAGVVTEIHVEENDVLKSYHWILSLRDTGTSATYDTLLRQRAEQEKLLMELLTIYRDGAILSPMDGIVSSVEYGQEDTSAAAQLGAMTGQTEAEDTQLLTIYPNVSMSVSVSIDETDILALQVGQEADVEVSSVSTDTVYTGTVTEISKTADTTSGVTQYSAVVTLDKVEGMLPGMTASVDVKIEGVEDVIIIPTDALHQTSTIYFVYTSYDEETQQYGGRVEVTIGMQNDDFVEITSGLSEGDTVYYVEPEETFNFADMFGGGSPFGQGGGPFGQGGQMPGGFGGFGG